MGLSRNKSLPMISTIGFPILRRMASGSFFSRTIKASSAIPRIIRSGCVCCLWPEVLFRSWPNSSAARARSMCLPGLLTADNSRLSATSSFSPNPEPDEVFRGLLLRRGFCSNRFLRIVRRGIHANQQSRHICGHAVTMFHASRDTDVITSLQCCFHFAGADLHLAADHVKTVLGVRVNVLACLTSHLDQIGS